MVIVVCTVNRMFVDNFFLVLKNDESKTKKQLKKIKYNNLLCMTILSYPPPTTIVEE